MEKGIKKKDCLWLLKLLSYLTTFWAIFKQTLFQQIFSGRITLTLNVIEIKNMQCSLQKVVYTINFCSNSPIKDRHFQSHFKIAGIMKSSKKMMK